MRTANENELQRGRLVHYWGQVRRVLNKTETLITLSCERSYNQKIIVPLPNDFILTDAPKSADDLINDLYS